MFGYRVKMQRPPRVRRPPRRDYDTPRQVIALVKQYPCLWDFRLPDYFKKEFKDWAWGEIAKHFHGMNGE